MLSCGEREAMVMAPPPRMTQQYRLASTAAWLSSTGLSHHNLLPHIPSTRPSSQQQPSAWGCSTIPKHQLPAAAPSSWFESLSGECMAVARTVWFSFHLGCHRSAVSLSALNGSPLTQTIAPTWGSDSCFSSPTAEGRSSPTNTPVFPPSSSILLGFAWVYIFFSTGRVLLSALSWYSACTSVSEGVFLMYPWGEMYTTSTYSSAILFSTVSSAQSFLCINRPWVKVERGQYP